MRATAGARAAAMVIATAVLLAACRTGSTARPTASASFSTSPSSPAGPDATLSPAPTGSPVPGTFQVVLWFAGFRVAAHPDALDADTQEFMDLVGTAIDVAQVRCFVGGLPARYARNQNAYILGVIADSRERLDEVIRSTGREPLFARRVRTVCWD